MPGAVPPSGQQPWGQPAQQQGPQQWGQQTQPGQQPQWGQQPQPGAPAPWPQQNPPQWTPQPKPEPLPVELRAYHHFYRTPAHRWWKPLALVALVGAAWIAISVVLVTVAGVVDLALGQATAEELVSGAIPSTPTFFLANNLTLAALIPISMLGQWLVYRQRPRWLSSVEGGLRWRWVWLCTAIILPVWLIYVGIELALTGFQYAGSQVALWLTVILLTTPFQAAGEEYGLRGTLTRATAAYFRDPRLALAVGTLVASVVFMLLHAAEDPWLNVYYFGFALVASLLTWRTGGLEAAITFHVVNNLISLVATVLAGQMDSVFDRAVGAGSPLVLLPLVVAVAVSLVLDRLFARSRMRRVTAPGAPATRPEPTPPVLPQG
ncbi:CPBP family intramembrane metalloprotease [Auraticoccus sp. F435]|uniref:CPBP family intramembrane metalloprotease n=1 Tax=Auraticoccus cholistanensis TaxID=2656650 RepID=A0A6A9V210_9ACTN|nr:CPBP family intramembrane metalloprotease [Auraticoccus cholistanensis]